MTKPYFVKWLPDNGKIGVGDTVSFRHTKNSKESKLKVLEVLESENTVILKENEDFKIWTTLDNLCFKVKLFLFSRDIQIDDEVYFYRGQNLVREPLIVGSFLKEGSKAWYEKDFVPISDRKLFGIHSATNWGKKIGEISPEALSYVKEGDEFEEEQLGFINNIGAESRIPFMYYYDKLSSDRKIEKDFYIGIKGPCGHFH